MKIQFSNINIGFPAVNKEKISKSFNMQNADTYEFSCSNSKSRNMTFGKGLFSSIFSKNKKCEVKESAQNQPKEELNFRQAICAGLKDYFGEDIHQSALKSIITPEELQTELEHLKEENFIATKENLQNGIYKADLDYHSCFSNGKKNVTEIMDCVAKFANKYYQDTGNDFIFALTDRDTTEGLKHAIRIIGNNPQKFAHVKFIPGIKMTFAHEAPKSSSIGYENSEMLVYGINPFSKNIEDFITNTLRKRRNTVIEFIKKVNEIYPEFAYSIIEFAEQNRLKYDKDFTISNLYWRAREYAETKGDTAITGREVTPEKIIKESEAIIQKLHEIQKGSEEDTSAIDTTLTEESEINKTIKGVFDEYSTHYDEEQGKVVSSAENLYNDMIECLSKEAEKPILAICAPYYLSHYFNEKNESEFPKTLKFINSLKNDSNGMLKAFESIVPSYNLDQRLTDDKIKEFNDYIRANTNLLEVGGSFDKRFI